MAIQKHISVSAAAALEQRRFYDDLRGRTERRADLVRRARARPQRRIERVMEVARQRRLRHGG